MNIFQQSLFKYKIRKYYKKYIKGDDKNMEERLCPRCGNTYIEYPALSRRDNKTNICPTCGEEKTSEYTRTVGFYTETASWSSERKEEFKLRDWHPLNEKGVEG